MRHRAKQVKEKYRMREQKVLCGNCGANQGSRQGRNSTMGGNSELDSLDYDDIINQAATAKP